MKKNPVRCDIVPDHKAACRTFNERYSASVLHRPVKDKGQHSIREQSLKVYTIIMNRG